MKDDNYKLHLKNLHDEGWFLNLVKDEIVPEIPQLPSFQLNSDASQEETWKYISGVIDGAWIVLQKLGIEYER